ncbi:MAG: DUF3873 domain-containing protein [Desulfovibrio sp.]|nr:DUF3873 domain-containing protein [Desulfovibrio sp.]
MHSLPAHRPARLFDGELFSCTAISLEAARGKRDEWLKARSKA